MRRAAPAALALGALAVALTGCGDKKQLGSTQDCLARKGATRLTRAPKGLPTSKVLKAMRLGDTGLVGEALDARGGPIVVIANQALRDHTEVLRLQSLWRPPAGTDAVDLLRRCADG